ncbi:MAG: hypothetical protein Tsb0014_03580 [Pleurocapsa sp.]
MINKSATVGIKISEIKQQIIKLKHQNPVLTPEEQQKLKQLKKNLHHLYQTYDIELEN